VRALSATPLGVPGKALRLRWPGGYQARLRKPGNAVPSKTTHPLNIIDFTPHAAPSCSPSKSWRPSRVLAFARLAPFRSSR